MGELVEKNDVVEAKRQELQAAEKDLQTFAEEKVNSLLTEAKGKATLHGGGEVAPAPAGGGQ
jgi:hypothetical protein